MVLVDPFCTGGGGGNGGGIIGAIGFVLKYCADNMNPIRNTCYWNVTSIIFWSHPTFLSFVPNFEGT